MSLLAFAETIQLFPDGSIFIHIAIILLMIWVLNRTLFRPINSVLASRERNKGSQLGEAAEILENVSEKEAFYSRAMLEARSKGYTEPDPRDDLSGTDVGRKLVILAREMGLELELADVRIESLVPESLRKGSVEEFLQELPQHDKAMTDLVTRAGERGEVLRYVGVVDPEGQCSVALKSYPRSHAFAGTTGSDNIVAFTTQRYHTQSLIVQGPGAGPDVTAGGVFADLLRLASYVGGAG